METTEDVILQHENSVYSTSSQNWQIDKKLGSCLTELYNRSLWTDVSFRCSDHSVDNVADRIHAHTLVLAARSPVFQAMFYGACANGKKEVVREDIDKESLDCFQRYLYSDTTTLTEDLAINVLKIAHEYQVTGLVTVCSDFLKTVLNTNNACMLLDLGLLYDIDTLRDAACSFIDDNVNDIMETEEFLQISEKAIYYILRGDTLFCNETAILKGTENWAKRRCIEKGLPPSGKNIRHILGTTFYFLRFPIMSINTFLECTRRKGYFTLEEHEDMLEHITGRNLQLVTTNSTVKRIPRIEIVWFEPKADEETTDEIKDNTHSKFDIVISLNIKRKTFLLAFTLAKITPYLKFSTPLYNTPNSKYSTSVKGMVLPTSLELCVTGSIFISELMEIRNFSVMHSSVSDRHIKLDHPICLPKSETPYTLIIDFHYACEADNVMMTVFPRKIDNPVCSKSGNITMSSLNVIPLESLEFLNPSLREKQTDGDNMENAEQSSSTADADKDTEQVILVNDIDI